MPKKASPPIEITVFYPSNKDKRLELQKKAAGLHAQFVKDYVKRLSYSQDIKKQLIDDIISQ